MRCAFLAPLLLLAALGCGGSDLEPSTPIDATVTLAYTETLTVANAGGLALRFDAVTEDSRCPLNALCVSAGRAVVKVTVIGTAGAQAVEIASDPAAARAATAQGVRVEWQQLMPYPYAGQPTSAQDYRLTVRVVR